MSGIRLYVRMDRQNAKQFYAECERAFDDDGYALSINELVPESDSMWEVSVYVHDGAQEAEDRLAEIAASITGGIQIEKEILPDIDWVSHSLESLDRVRAGRVLLYGSHDRPSDPGPDVTVEIDAGQAFGTGHHGTTWGCLMMIQQVLKSGHHKNALDIGTGSAVLAIALSKLARIPVMATDNDPIAIKVARENVALNHAGNIEFVVAAGFRHQAIAAKAPYSLIVANILAKPLMALAPAMARHLELGGDVILSGILSRQRRAVIAAYVNAGFRHIRTLESEGWVTLNLKR